MTTVFKKAQDADVIRKFARSRKISRLVHFTPLNNLLGIMNLKGIWARQKIAEYARNLNDTFLLDYISYNDRNRFDGRMDCVNLSIEHINHFLFRRFRKEFKLCDVWSIIEISPECLEKEGVCFTTGNAASTYVRTHGTATGIDGLKALYEDAVTSGNMRGRRVDRRSASLPLAYPTNSQAEVLFPEEIPLSLIKAFVFEDERKCAQAKAALEIDNPGVEIPPCVIRPEDFDGIA